MKVAWGQPPSAVLDYQIAIASSLTKTAVEPKADWTAEGGCPHMIHKPTA